MTELPTIRTPDLVDVHVRFPGIQIEPELAFDQLWEGRCSQNIAHRPCSVPSLEVQRLIPLLHAARGDGEGDVHVAWTNATVAERNQVSALTIETKADVAFAAATGRLEEYRDRPEYDLWRLFADGEIGTRVLAAMAADAKAAPAGASRVHLRTFRHMVTLFRHKPQRLGTQLQRQPTRAEVVGAYFRMLRRGSDVSGRGSEDK